MIKKKIFDELLCYSYVGRSHTKTGEAKIPNPALL